MRNAELISILSGLPPDEEALVYLPGHGSVSIECIGQRGIGPAYTVIYPHAKLEQLKSRTNEAKLKALKIENEALKAANALLLQIIGGPSAIEAFAQRFNNATIDEIREALTRSGEEHAEEPTNGR